MDMVIVVVLGSTLDSTKWGLCGPRDLVGRMWIRKPLLPTEVNGSFGEAAEAMRLCVCMVEPFVVVFEVAVI